MFETGFELLSTLRQSIVSPRTFNKAIAPFLILLIGQANTFTPVAYSQQVGPITQNDARCDAQMKLLLKASDELLYTSESDYPFSYFSFSNTSKLPTT